ncbi:hypothetical protein HG530_011272 [Fusarium avenaceum]|nr:hypothetical protein HG530_011272 [Fusarium avenaceum]
MGCKLRLQVLVLIEHLIKLLQNLRLALLGAPAFFDSTTDNPRPVLNREFEGILDAAVDLLNVSTEVGRVVAVYAEEDACVQKFTDRGVGELGQIAESNVGPGAETRQGAVVEMTAVQKSVNESMRLRNREMAQNTDDQLDSNAQLLLSTVLGGCKSRNDSIIANASSNMRLRIKEDLSMSNPLARCPLKILVRKSLEVTLSDEHAHTEVVVVQEVVETCESTVAFPQLIGRFVDRVLWERDAILLSEGEEELRLKSSLDMKMLLNLWQGLKEAVKLRLAHRNQL